MKKFLSFCMVITLLLALIPSQAVFSFANKRNWKITSLSSAAELRTYVSFSGPTDYGDDQDFNGFVDVQLQLRFDPDDYAALAQMQSGDIDARFFTNIGQIIAINPDYFSMVDAYTEDSDALVRAKASLATNYYEYTDHENIAFFSQRVPVYSSANSNRLRNVAFDIGTSAVSYNADINTYYALLQTLELPPGYMLAKPEEYNTVAHLYLKLKENVNPETVMVNEAIRLVRESELGEGGDCLAADTFIEENYISSQLEPNGFVPNASIAFSDDFYPKHDITFQWLGDEDVPQSTTVRTTVDTLPQAPEVPTHQTGDYLYTFENWDKELAPSTKDTTYTATYTSVFLGHDYESVVTTQPSCTEEGLRTYTCKRCGYSYTETIDKIAHTPVPLTAIAPDCTNTGLTEGSKCSVCGEILVAQQTIPANGHNPASPVTENNVNPTCEQAGSYDSVIYCSVCEAEISRTTVPVEALGHIWGDWVQTTDPDCTNAGEETKYCQRDASHFETRPVEALGHDFHGVITPPTCTEQGYTTYTCSRCSESHVADFVDPSGHLPQEAVTENNVNPDCEHAGSYDSVVYCSVCEAEISRTTVPVEALGHNYESRVIAPTTKAGGYTVHTCTRCADEYMDSFTDRIPVYYAVPSLNSQECTLILKNDDKVFELHSSQGKFLVNDVEQGEYRAYVTAKNGLIVALGLYNTEQGDYTLEENVRIPIGDVNADGVIDIADLSVLLAEGNYDSAQANLDLTGDDYININDLNTILRQDNFAKVSDPLV